MTKDTINGFHENPNAAFVLHEATPNDVARAMIESAKQTEPFHVFDMDEAYRRIVHFKNMMPRVQIFYAMKANDCEMILKLAIALGLGFDCASPGEIYKVLQLNSNPKSIIFALPTKTPEQMMFARDSGVSHTTFDTSYELKKIKKFWPDASLLIRIKVVSESVYQLGDKYGCDAETEAVDLLEEASALGLHVAGVAFHVGSVCLSIDSYTWALRNVKVLFDHEARAGRRMSIIDIGGGFISDQTNRIDEVAKLVNMALEEYFPDPDIQVIAEPGRYICDSSTTLYCSINNVRTIKKENETVNMIYLNDGIFGTLRYNETWHTVEKFKITTSKEDENTENTILWGPSCDSWDRIMLNCVIRLPKCTPSDWLVFKIQGAYTFVFSTVFSSLPVTQIRSVISEELWNKVKDSMVFNMGDFVTNPYLAAPLPLQLPRILPKKPTYVGPQYTLKL